MIAITETQKHLLVAPADGEAVEVTWTVFDLNLSK